MIKLNRAGYVDLMLSMSDAKSFNLVKEHKGNLHNAWKACWRSLNLRQKSC